MTCKGSETVESGSAPLQPLRAHGGKSHLGHDLPVIEHTLGEGLAGGGSPERGGEAEGLHDWQVGLEVEDGGARPLSFLEDVAALLIENRVDATQCLRWKILLLAMQQLNAFKSQQLSKDLKIARCKEANSKE